MFTLNKNSSFWKISEYLFYFVVFLFPFIKFRGFLYSGTSTRFAIVAILATLLGLGFSFWLYKKNSNISFSRSPILISLSIYFLSLVLSAIFGIDFWNSFWSMATRTSGLWFLASLATLMLLAFSVFYDRAKQRALIFTIIISSAIYSLLGFLSDEGVNIIFKKYASDGFTFGNSTFAGMYIFAAFLLSVYYLFTSQIKKWWMYFIPVIFLINPNILNRDIWFGNFSNGLVGEARASAYVMLLSVFALLIFYGLSKIKNEIIKRRVAYTVFAVGIVAAAYSVFSLLFPNGFVRDLYMSQATSARPLVWELSEKAISERPILGWGGDNFERVFERNYDNRLLEGRYGGEAWFDRAHNVVVDQLLDNGYLGFILYASVYIVIVLSLIYVILNSREMDDKVLATVLVVYFPLHFVELQTAFDTTISYFILAIMTVFAAILFDRTYKEKHPEKENINVNPAFKYVLASALLLFFAWSGIFGLLPFLQAESANGYIRTVGSAEKRLPIYGELFGSPVDEHSFLWRLSTDFQRGIGQNPKVLEEPAKVAFLKKEIELIENEYRKYVEENPTHYRAHLSLADVLLYENLFGVNKLEEAQKVLDDAIALVPQSPQPYWMKAVAYVYMRKFDLAREMAKKAVELNPGVEESQKISKYVEDSIKTFPEIDLYFFQKI